METGGGSHAHREEGEGANEGETEEGGDEAGVDGDAGLGGEIDVENGADEGV